MNDMDDHLKLVHDLRPAILDHLADDGYARHRDHDMARAIAEGPAHPSSARLARLPLGRGRQRWSHRRARSVGRAMAAAGAAAAVLLAVAAQFGLWQHGTSGGSAATPVTNPLGTMRHGFAPPGTSPRMRLIDAASSPFRTTGTGPQSASFQCVTAAVCYFWDTGPGGGSAERTADGGASWQQVAALPDHLSLLQAGQSPSCPTTEVCIAMVEQSLQLAITTDGGAGWSLDAVPAPAGSSGASIDSVSCPTALKCVVHVADHGAGAFMLTSNRGQTWTESSALPKDAPVNLGLLRCDPDGKCVGLQPTSTAATDVLASMRSADGGRTWIVTSVPLPRTAIYQWSCGDALHCMLITSWRHTTMTTTSDGGLTWRDIVAPASWPSAPTDVSCAGPDCFIALSTYTSTVQPPFAPGYYHGAAIEAVYNGATTWTTLSLPHVGGSQLTLVFPLSCPSPAGCVGAATTPQQDADASPRRVIISSFPPAGPQAAGG